MNSTPNPGSLTIPLVAVAVAIGTASPGTDLSDLLLEYRLRTFPAPGCRQTDEEIIETSRRVVAILEMES